MRPPVAPGAANPARARGDSAPLPAWLAHERKDTPLTFWVVTLFLFVIYSRVSDYLAPSARIPAITLVAALAAATATGAWRVWMSPVGLAHVFLCVWIGVGVPFSSWVGGSFGTLKTFLISTIILVPLAGIPSRVREMRILFYTFAAAVWMIFAFSLVFTRTGDRLGLAGGLYGNANDLALIMLLAIPFWWFILQDLDGVLPAVAFVGGMLPILYTLMRTGSRGGLLGLGALGAVLFLRSGRMARLRMLAMGAALGLALVALAPEQLLARYQTTFSSLKGGDAEDAEDEAHISTQSRLNLLTDALRYTIENPIIGLGAGQFAVTRGEERQKRGLYGKWLTPHNAYMQMASECGLPALAAMLFILYWSWKKARYIRRLALGNPSPEGQRLAVMAGALEAAIAGYAVMAFTLSLAYQGQLFTLAAFAYGLNQLEAVARWRPPAAGSPSAPAQPAARPRFVTSRAQLRPAT